MSSPQAEHRIGYIDGLRAIAVLAVVLVHMGKHSSLAPASALGFLLRQGAHGVDLFFVLSGFCLAYPTLRKRISAQSAFDIFRYAAHRVVRIVPPYWTAIAVLVGFSLAVGKHVDFGNAVRYGMFIDVQLPQLNNSFWTLPVEFRWYFAFPVLLYVWTHSRRAFAALFVAIIMSTFTRAWSGDLGTLPAFMLGIVAAEAYIEKWPFARYAGWLFLALFALDAYASVPAWGDDFGIRWYLAFFALVLAGGYMGAFRWVLERPIARFIGTASYSIYLIHEPVITYLEAHNVPMIVAGLAGVAGGILFWFLVERLFTQGSYRQVLIARAERIIAAGLTRAGVPRFIEIGKSAIPQTTIVLEPRDPVSAVEEPAFAVN